MAACSPSPQESNDDGGSRERRDDVRCHCSRRRPPRRSPTRASTATSRRAIALNPSRNYTSSRPSARAASDRARSSVAIGAVKRTARSRYAASYAVRRCLRASATTRRSSGLLSIRIGKRAKSLRNMSESAGSIRPRRSFTIRMLRTSNHHGAGTVAWSRGSRFIATSAASESVTRPVSACFAAPATAPGAPPPSPRRRHGPRPPLAGLRFPALPGAPPPVARRALRRA